MKGRSAFQRKREEREQERESSLSSSRRYSTNRKGHSEEAKRRINNIARERFPFPYFSSKYISLSVCGVSHLSTHCYGCCKRMCANLCINLTQLAVEREFPCI